MKKIARVEEQKNHLLYQFLEKLNREVPYQENKQKLEDSCVHQYKLLVNMSFSANILYKGLDYAGHVYNHVAKIEYTRLCKMIIKQNFDKDVTEELLKKLKKAQNELFLHSPLTKESEGIDIFYGFTGGNRKKYKANRNAIKRMYAAIKQESEKNLFRYIKDSCRLKYARIKEKRDYALWLLKSYTWH
ncbi:hypothetical protein A5821_000339 [Enterococcus sp. 7F3_DIV0205]|uniref:Uncharacterized protein n=1 Tax=Candidatus Enterococcus palustris TaxID=1834189 RepID=A0AAQ3W5Y7_9ENTE|nr:hypothetical protein [Enterococcus sp. 7F3_DIV0205]OTN84752.1 hypothetical protein A5821_000681 [Enterococcus sp. 7F3_DIV0205]